LWTRESWWCGSGSGCGGSSWSFSRRSSRRREGISLATGNVVRPIARTERWIEKQTGRALAENSIAAGATVKSTAIGWIEKVAVWLGTDT